MVLGGFRSFHVLVTTNRPRDLHRSGTLEMFLVSLLSIVYV